MPIRIRTPLVAPANAASAIAADLAGTSSLTGTITATGVFAATLAGTSSCTGSLTDANSSGGVYFPPSYFGPDHFGPDYFGGETDPNAMSAALAGTSSVSGTLSNGGAATAPTFSPITFSSVTFSTRDEGAISATINGEAEFLATISVAAVAVEDDDSGYWARVVKKRRERKAKALKPVPGVLAAKIVGRSAVTALGTAPRVGWPCDIVADIMCKSGLRAGIDGPDRIAEQDEQDLEDLTAILMLLAA